MLDFIDTLTSAQALTCGGLGLMFLAVLAHICRINARIDRISARNDRRLSEIDRNAAAELYRLATYERQRDAELVQQAYEELKLVVALYEAREARRSTPWESLGIAARNVG